MTEITRDRLRAFIDDGLSESESAAIEQALRGSDELRRELQAVMQERERGDHSIGAIWRRARLTCPTREQLGSYLLQVLDPPVMDYIQFHLRVVECPYCTANLTDLETRQQEAAHRAQERRQRFFTSSRGYLPK